MPETPDKVERPVTGRIIKGVGGLYTVLPDENPDERIRCCARGTLRLEKSSPTVGDRVQVETLGEGKGCITDVFPRKNVLLRPACANVDLLVITACPDYPKPDLYMLDKLSAVALHHGIEVLFVFNKCDVCDASTLSDIYKKAGFPVLTVSTRKKEEYREAFDAIRERMRGKITFFAGASGVGKSSLVGVLFPSLQLATGTLSRKIARGRHTTRATELYIVGEDTYVADTPGFSSLDVALYGMIPREKLLETFPEIHAHATGCTFADCTHTGEGSDVCMVKRAVAQGKIAPSRHESFVRLYREIAAVKDWEKRGEPGGI